MMVVQARHFMVIGKTNQYSTVIATRMSSTPEKFPSAPRIIHGFCRSIMNEKITCTDVWILREAVEASRNHGQRSRVD